MSYAVDINLRVLTGESLPPVKATLWILDFPPDQQPTAQWTTQVQAASSFTATLGPGADPETNISLPRKDIALTIENALTSADFWFRTDRSVALPTSSNATSNQPAVMLEIVLAAPIVQQLSGFLRPPLGSSAGITVDALALVSVSSANLANVTASGRAGTAGFQYSATYALEKATDVAKPSLDVSETSKTFIPRTLTPQVQDAIVRIVRADFLESFRANIITKVLSDLAAARLIAPGQTTLPDGVVLTLRNITSNNNGTGITVTPALGAFDGVISRFRPPPFIDFFSPILRIVESIRSMLFRPFKRPPVFPPFDNG